MFSSLFIFGPPQQSGPLEFFRYGLRSPFPYSDHPLASIVTVPRVAMDRRFFGILIMPGRLQDSAFGHPRGRPTVDGADRPLGIFPSRLTIPHRAAALPSSWARPAPLDLPFISRRSDSIDQMTGGGGLDRITFP